VKLLCNMLQHTATHSCNTLQHTATHCNVHCNTLVQHTATHCDTPQHTATHRNTLQHTRATHCNTVKEGVEFVSNELQGKASDSTVSATHCNTLQHTRATHCNTRKVWSSYPRALSFRKRALSFRKRALSFRTRAQFLQGKASNSTVYATLSHSVSRMLLQHTATHYSTLQQSLQHTATLSHSISQTLLPHTLQHTTTHCNTLTHSEGGEVRGAVEFVLQSVSPCNSLDTNSTPSFTRRCSFPLGKQAGQ